MKKTLLLSPALLLCVSCATLFSDKADKITINSDPTGAEVFINGEIKGKTPLDITIERDTFKATTAQIKKKGYAVHEMRLAKTFNTTTLFNIGFLCFSETSAGIDALTGAIVKYSPTSYLVTLNKVSADAGKTNPNKTLYVLVNEHQLRNDIARGSGTYLDGLFDVYQLDAQREINARKRIFSQREVLLQTKKGVDLNSALDQLVI